MLFQERYYGKNDEEPNAVASVRTEENVVLVLDEMLEFGRRSQVSAWML